MKKLHNFLRKTPPLLRPFVGILMLAALVIAIPILLPLVIGYVVFETLVF